MIIDQKQNLLEIYLRIKEVLTQKEKINIKEKMMMKNIQQKMIQVNLKEKGVAVLAIVKKRKIIKDFTQMILLNQ
jgi:hypothetical protein